MFLEFLLLFLATDLNIHSSSTTAVMKKESRKEETIVHIYTHTYTAIFVYQTRLLADLSALADTHEDMRLGSNPVQPL